ncbi:large ribosomal subunit protein bL9m [Pyxicephalus adspersus]|uniref:large ribosomal subunit protein bL9m n=1 Tax=Pyxicephalus adspersus TaxID=30357 RepID=UPI003B5A98F7
MKPLTTFFFLQTVKFLQNSRLEVIMREDVDWTLNKEIVARQFSRNLGVVVPVEALKLPEEPISTFGEYWCEVTVNGIDTVRMPMDVVKFDRPRSKRYRYWLSKQAAREKSSTEQPPEGSGAPESPAS